MSPLPSFTFPPPDLQTLLDKPLLLTAVGKTYHEAKRNQLFSLVASALDEDRQSAGPDSVAAGMLFSAASVWNQTDWGGGSVYLDGSMPAPAPDRWAACWVGRLLVCPCWRCLVDLPLGAAAADSCRVADAAAASERALPSRSISWVQDAALPAGRAPIPGRSASHDGEPSYV